MIGYKLTPQQAAQIKGAFLNENTKFFPVEDINGNWFIFEQEVNEIINDAYFWIKHIAPENFTPKQEINNG